MRGEDFQQFIVMPLMVIRSFVSGCLSSEKHIRQVCFLYNRLMTANRRSPAQLTRGTSKFDLILLHVHILSGGRAHLPESEQPIIYDNRAGSVTSRYIFWLLTRLYILEILNESDAIPLGLPLLARKLKLNIGSM